MNNVEPYSFFSSDTAYSPEFRLAVECCRASFAEAKSEAAIRVISRTVNWGLFLKTVRFHRVQGLAWKGLSAAREIVPSDIWDALSTDAHAIAMDNLKLAVEARELRALFDQGGIASLFVKGLTVGALAYPDPMLKMGWDIDLLIDPAQLEGAAGVLRDRGYHLVSAVDSHNLAKWHARRKDSEWERDGVHIELHTRLTENRRLLPAVNVHSPRQEVAVVPGVTLPTLGRDELFAYLCVHGASSLWFRLKWITDLAAMLEGVTTAEIERLYVSSQKLGAGCASGYALLLADRIYATLSPSMLRTTLAKDVRTKWLVKSALRQLAGRFEPREPTSFFGGTAAIHLSQFFLLPGYRFKLSELWRQLRSAIA